MSPQLKGDAVNGYQLSGTLTYETVPEVFRSNSLDYQSTTDLDLAEIQRADSAGLALLVEWSSVARKQGKVLVLKNVPVPLQALINITGLQRVLSFSNS